MSNWTRFGGQQGDGYTADDLGAISAIGDTEISAVVAIAKVGIT